jgi:hypothetical protein
MRAPRSITAVPCDPVLFDQVARHSCDTTPLADTLQGCAAVWLELEGGGDLHLAVRQASPAVVEIVAAQGRAEQGSVLDVLPWLEAQWAPMAVQMVTQRRGLVRELGKRGYHVAGVILRKEAPHGRQIQ